jgi:hypothetical protein
MDPILHILGAHPLGTLLLLVLLLLVWPEVLTPAERTLAALTIVGIGAVIAVPLELWSRMRRHGQKRSAARQLKRHPAGLGGTLSPPPRPSRGRIVRPTRATRKRA